MAYMKGYLTTEYSALYYDYHRCKKPNAETILLVHGMGLDQTIWDEAKEGLTKDYHILRYDLPGNGQSTLYNLDSFGWHLLIEDLEALLHHLKIKEVHFVGHSGAGNFGVELALHEKNYVKSLTLISTPLFTPSEIIEQEIKERNLWENEDIFEKNLLQLAKNISEYFSINRDVIALRHPAQMDLADLQSHLKELKIKKDKQQRLFESLELFQSLPENICPDFYDDWLLRIKGNIEFQILKFCEDFLKMDLEDEHEADLLKVMVKFNPLEVGYYERLLSILRKMGSPEFDYYLKQLNKITN